MLMDLASERSRSIGERDFEYEPGSGDVRRSVRRGRHDSRTAMVFEEATPSWRVLGEQQIRDLTAFVKSLS